MALQIFRDKPDILFVPSHVVPYFCKTKYIVTIHDIAFKKFPESYPLLFQWYLDFTTKQSVKNSHKIITISESTKKDLVNIYGADESKIEVVYMGFDQESKKARKQESIKEKFGIKKDYLFYLGRVESKKNIVNLVKAFYELLAKGEDLQLVLAGKRGYGFEEIEKTIKDFSLGDRVVLTGYVNDEEKEYLLKNSSVFTFISLYEGFGIPVLEAFASGIPCVLSCIPVFEELFREAAFLVDHNDPEKIAEGILEILKNEKKKKDLVRKGRELIKEFSWEKCARETLKVLEK